MACCTRDGEADRHEVDDTEMNKVGSETYGLAEEKVTANDMTGEPQPWDDFDDPRRDITEDMRAPNEGNALVAPSAATSSADVLNKSVSKRSIQITSNEDLSSVQYRQLDIAKGARLITAVDKRNRARYDDEEEHGHGHGGHGHSKKPSLLNALISGFINYLLMFGLCCAYGMIMFDADFQGKHRALGVKLNLSTAFIAGLALAWKSKVGVAIGGPDLNPVVFIGGFVETMSEEIADKVGLKEYHDEATEDRRLGDDSIFEVVRRLAGGGGGASDFCSSGWKDGKYAAECEEYHDRLRATAIFATAVTSALLGLIYFLLGYMKVTRMVSFVPTSVQEAFLSCIGYKVFKYALSFCNYKPLMFIPAMVIGVVMYFMKAMHVGNPAIVIPVMLAIPLVIFYIVVLAAGLDIESMRETGASDNWMFPELTHVDFWELWTDSYGKADMITIKAWVKTLPDLAIMVIVCVIDCLLKISSTESKLPVKVDKDYEAQLYGITNILTTLTGSSVGYMQLKFNVINYGVVGNVKDRRGGVFYAFLCGVCFFTTIGHFNFLPRFFLGTLLFFAGAGFVAENLWGSRQFLSFTEWGEILAILAVFIFSGSLLYAVIVGGLVTCVSLIMKYTQVSCIAGHPLPGGHMTSCSERRNPLLLGQLSHIADSWFLVIRLKGFIFFASAQKMTAKIMKLIEARQHLPEYRRFRYIVLDCEMLDGMDASAGKSIRKFIADTASQHITIFWSSVSGERKKDLLNKRMMAHKDHGFSSLSDAIHFIEEKIIKYQSDIQQQWLNVDMMFKVQHNLVRYEDDQDPWGSVLLKPTARRGCPWRYCSTTPLKKCETILWEPGELNPGMFLVHSGKVALFTHIPKMDGSVKEEWPSPVATYGFGWFLNREFIFGKPAKHYAIAIADGEVINWSNYQWWKMFSEHPEMSAEMMRAVHFQSTLDLGPMKWMAEIEADSESRDMKEQLQSQEDLTEDAIKIDKRDELQSAMHYSDKHRAALPQQLKLMIDAFEIAEAFGKLGAYDKIDDADLAPLAPLPNWIGHDLKVSFDTHSVQMDGEEVLISEQAMSALCYAGLPRVFVAFSAKPYFTRDEYMQLGHHAAMARLPKSLDKLVRQVMADHRKKHDIDTLEPHHVADLLRSAFHRSFSSELVQGLVEEVGSQEDVTDEIMFLTVFSRLLRHHEQYWNLLAAIKRAADPSKTDPKESVSVNTFTCEALSKLLPEGASGPAAAEMLWACDWPRRDETKGEHWGQHLHVYDVAVVVLSQLLAPTGSLAKPPIMMTEERAKSTDPVKRQESGNDMAKFIVHLPSLLQSVDSGETVEFRRLSTKKSGVVFEGIDLEETSDNAIKTLTLSEMEREGPLSLRAKINVTLEDPASSTAANIISLFMGGLILISILSMLVEPVTQHGREDDLSQAEEDIWLVFEGFLTITFSIEYLVRVSVANALGTMTTFAFIITPANICDFFAIVPFYVRIAFGGEASELRLLRVVRLLRLSRIARLGRLASRNPLFPPIACVLLVIWGIYMKSEVSGGK